MNDDKNLINSEAQVAYPPLVKTTGPEIVALITKVSKAPLVNA